MTNSINPSYIVVKLGVGIKAFYGLYPTPEEAQAKAVRMALYDTSSYHSWDVFEYDGFNKWIHTGYKTDKDKAERERE